MEDEYISKKELLELTGISYGQLYRWKRKGLIPEEWFIKKSSYTGQETFLPRNKVLARVEKIKDMKDDIPLDDIADVFSPDLYKICLNVDEFTKRNIVSPQTLAFYRQIRCITQFEFNDILFAYILDNLLVKGDISLDEGIILLETLHEGFANFKDGLCEAVLIRKFGVFVCLLISPPNNLRLEKGGKLICRVNVATFTEELKLKLI
jgi:hypothetical protein